MIHKSKACFFLSMCTSTSFNYVCWEGGIGEDLHSQFIYFCFPVNCSPLSLSCSVIFLSCCVGISPFPLVKYSSPAVGIFFSSSVYE